MYLKFQNFASVLGSAPDPHCGSLWLIFLFQTNDKGRLAPLTCHEYGTSNILKSLNSKNTNEKSTSRHLILLAEEGNLAPSSSQSRTRRFITAYIIPSHLQNSMPLTTTYIERPCCKRVINQVVLYTYVLRALTAFTYASLSVGFTPIFCCRFVSLHWRNYWTAHRTDCQQS